MTSKLAHRRETFKTNVYEIFFGYSGHNLKKELIERTRSSSLTTEIKKMKGFEHVCRMSPDAQPRTAFRWTENGKLEIRITFLY